MKETKKFAKERGITLIALVITVVILIILATVTLNVVLGEDGLIQKAQQAKEMTEQAASEEQQGLNSLMSEFTNIMAEDQKPPEPEREETRTHWDGPIASDFEMSDSNVYYIANESQLAYLAKIVNEGDNCDNMRFVITRDISLNGHEWVPIGNNSERCFNGTFDFNSCTISDISIENEQYDYRGLFGNVGENASFNSGTINNTNIKGYNYVGTLAGKNQGLIKDISFNNNVIEGNENVGGIAGYNSGNIENLSSAGGTVSGLNNVGGIAGYNSGNIRNAMSDLIVTGTSNYGQIVGKNEGELEDM